MKIICSTVHSVLTVVEKVGGGAVGRTQNQVIGFEHRFLPCSGMHDQHGETRKYVSLFGHIKDIFQQKMRLLTA